MNLLFSLLTAAIVAGSWNAKWFPTGRAMHRGEPEAEKQTIQDAGAYLRSCIEKTRKAPDDDIIICLNEIRCESDARALCVAIGITNLNLATISRYRLKDRIDTQQDAIITTLPIVSSSFSRWKHNNKIVAPRGKTQAVLNYKGKEITVYSIHLKSHYGETSEQLTFINDKKRQLAVKQLSSEIKTKKDPVIVGGDFNMDFGAGRIQDLKLLEKLQCAGLQNLIEYEGNEKIITFPGTKKRPGSTLDYIMTKNIEPVAKPKSFPIKKSISDHYAVFVLIQ